MTISSIVGMYPAHAFQNSLVRLLTLTSRLSKGDKVGDVNLAPAAFFQAPCRRALLRHLCDNRFARIRAKTWKSAGRVTRRDVCSPPACGATMTLHAPREFAKPAGRSHFGRSKSAALGPFDRHQPQAIAPRPPRAEMEAHRLEAYPCQTIQTRISIAATASRGAGCLSLSRSSLPLWHFSRFWAQSARAGAKGHQPKMPSHPQPLTPQARRYQPNNPSLAIRTASGGRLRTPAFCVPEPMITPLTGAHPC